MNAILPIPQKTCHVLALMGVAIVMWTSGCEGIFKRDSRSSHRNSLLKPIVAPRDAIDLEVYFIDRRIGDPLIGSALWGSLQEISSLSPETRHQLTSDGFRFAMSPSRPPSFMQSLISDSDDTDIARRVSKRRYTLESGKETWLMVSEIPDGTAIVQENDGILESMNLVNGQALLRVQAERVEDGWTKLTVIPEIRYGLHALRAQPTDEGFVYQQGQKSLVFYEDRLSAELNLGEIVILGLSPEAPDALAKHFFRSDVSRGIERLILIRVADMREVAPVRSTDL
ncbi:MAG: hypothetical protein KDA80_20865 [Planctomycetaceae bacterium]|nr:hypothetical protein [Planctomycetaceae bacterium]